ncbi:hypothetical protein [Candidatus Hepatoplasma crinochetorum]|uniref:hypothetical protein n=1 Tax=Candidatus Hepatoplasma crinochetorum TaxID=295596 RepID=UPI003090800E|nr:MAG: hypothetical protein HCTKY_3730 [Candidatus Hepatoplasma crinochetorum]
MTQKIKDLKEINVIFQSFFKEENLNILKILYFRNGEYTNKLLKNKNQKINEKNISDFFQIYIYLKITKDGYINPLEILKIYENFPNYVNYYEKNINKKEIESFTLKIFTLIKNLDKLNDKISSTIYPYIFSFEKNINYLIDSKFLSNNLDITMIDFNNKKTKNKLNEKIIKLKEEYKEENLILQNLKIIKKLYFREKFFILKWLWKNKYLNLKDLEKRNFISKIKIKELQGKFKNKFSSEEIDYKVWEYILQRFSDTNKFRNSISHLENLILTDKDIKKLINYFSNQYQLLRNNYTISIFYKIKIHILTNNFISNDNLIYEYYKKIINFDFKKANYYKSKIQFNSVNKDEKNFPENYSSI